MTFRSKFAICALLLCGSVCALAQQAAWPTRPVKWIVPWAAGGISDATGRLIARKLEEKWGQPVLIDNRPGGNTAVGAVETAHAAPDGYTLFQPLNATLTINPFAFAKLPYDPVRDFTPIAIYCLVPLIIAANDTLPAKTMSEFVALAKSRPEGITVGGAGLSTQLATQQLMRDMGVKILYVPYKSGSDITKALLSGDIQIGVDGATAYLPLIKNGRLKGLATISSKRITESIPTVAELGLQKTKIAVWTGISAPAGLPTEIRNKIANDLQAVLAVPELRDKLVELGLEPIWMGADEFAALIKTESAVMGPLVKELGIRVD